MIASALSPRRCHSAANFLRGLVADLPSSTGQSVPKLRSRTGACAMRDLFIRLAASSQSPVRHSCRDMTATFVNRGDTREPSASARRKRQTVFALETPRMRPHSGIALRTRRSIPGRSPSQRSGREVAIVHRVFLVHRTRLVALGVVQARPCMTVPPLDQLYRGAPRTRSRL